MILARSLRNGNVEIRHGPPALLEALSTEEPDWISVIAPTEGELDALARDLKLHTLALRDALKEDQPPKLEDFGEYIFFIVHTPVAQAWSQTRKIAVFLAKNWIVTVQTTESDAMDAIAARVEKAPEHLLPSPDALAHVVIDHMTGGFEGLTADLLEELTRLEDRVLGDPSPASMEAILKLRRRVVGLSRVTRS